MVETCLNDDKPLIIQFAIKLDTKLDTEITVQIYYIIKDFWHVFCLLPVIQKSMSQLLQHSTDNPSHPQFYQSLHCPGTHTHSIDRPKSRYMYLASLHRRAGLFKELPFSHILAYIGQHIRFCYLWHMHKSLL